MSISRSDFDAICELDLTELIKGSVPESLHIEYKQESYGKKEADKKELLNDVSAFANANGGHIVIGIAESKEDKVVTFKLCGIKTNAIDQEVSRIDQIIRSGIEPHIPSCRVRAVPLPSLKSQAIIIRILKSWNLPHRVCAYNSNRYWIRNSAGKHEASMDELKNLFTLSASAIERVRSFRTKRINHLTNTGAFKSKGRFVFHIVPLSAVSTTATIDAKRIYENYSKFQPIDDEESFTRYNLDGVINICRDNEKKGYTQIYRNGSVEAVIDNLISSPYQGRWNIKGQILEKKFFNVFSNYINGLKAIDIEPPLVLMLTLEHVRNVHYLVKDDGNKTTFDHDVINLPECIIDEFGSDESYHRAIKPAFDAIWNAMDYPEAYFFNRVSGLWNGLWNEV